MTKTGEMVQDLSKGVVPVMAVLGILGFVWTAATWVSKQTGQTDNMSTSFIALSNKVDQLSIQVNALSMALAQGPKLPENIAYKMDILELCVLNPKLICSGRNK